MLDFIVLTLVFAGGFVASIYSWPWIRARALGVTGEATRLRQRARDLEAQIGRYL